MLLSASVLAFLVPLAQNHRFILFALLLRISKWVTLRGPASSLPPWDLQARGSNHCILFRSPSLLSCFLQTGLKVAVWAACLLVFSSSWWGEARNPNGHRLAHSASGVMALPVVLASGLAIACSVHGDQKILWISLSFLSYMANENFLKGCYLEGFNWLACGNVTILLLT